MMLAAAANKNRGRKGGKKKLGGKGETDKSQESKVTNGPKIRYTEDGFAVTTLYLRGSDVSYLTHDQLLAHFSEFGEIQKVRIHKQPTHSYGFVTFQQAVSASRALKTKSHQIGRCKVQVLIADSWHQQQQSMDHQNGQSRSDKELPIELTNITGTFMLDLNDDCLYEILSLKMLTVMDLCSIAETSVRLKEIAIRVFVAKYKIFNFNSTIDESATSIHEIRRVLINFGSFISELSIRSSIAYMGISTRIVDLIVRYCSKTLGSLNLIDYEITEHLTVKLKPLFNKLKKLYIKDGTVMGAGKSLFANCGSLIELNVIGLINCSDDMSLILENTFPKLELFICKEIEDLDEIEEVRKFIVRHKDLKTFSVNGFSYDCSSLFPVIADNLKQLEVLQIKGAETYETCQQYSQSVMRLLSLDQLKKLKLNCDGQSTTQFMNGLHSLKSLEFLELWHAADHSFIPAISKIKSLNVLRLMDCVKIADLDELGELDQLKELVIRRPGVTGTFNLINLIKKLINLKTLYLEMDAFKMDQATYLKIVDIVRKRPVKQALEITSDTADEYVADIQNDGDNRKIVKFNKFFKWNHSSTDGSIDDYNLDDDDDDDDVSWDFDHFAYPFDGDLYFNGYYGGFGGSFGFGFDSDDDDVDDLDIFPF